MLCFSRVCLRLAERSTCFALVSLALYVFKSLISCFYLPSAPSFRHLPLLCCFLSSSFAPHKPHSVATSSLPLSSFSASFSATFYSQTRISLPLTICLATCSVSLSCLEIRSYTQHPFRVLLTPAPPPPCLKNPQQSSNKT